MRLINPVLRKSMISTLIRRISKNVSASIDSDRNNSVRYLLPESSSRSRRDKLRDKLRDENETRNIRCIVFIGCTGADNINNKCVATYITYIRIGTIRNFT